MRECVVVCALFLYTASLSQQSAPADPLKKFSRWTIGLSFLTEFDLGGYTAVREFAFVGDKLDLKRDLGMDQWRSLSIAGEYHLKNNSSVSLSVEDFFFSGYAIVNKDIWFNGVHMSGYEGISPSRTELYRMKFTYEKKIHPERRIHPSICAGLVMDNLIFYVTGRILPITWSIEQSENFALHALPFPYLGAKVHDDLSATSFLEMEASGTYIPSFKSFFHEGGSVWLHYYTAQAGVSYGLRIKGSTFQLGCTYRCLKILQDSGEDTNDIFFSAIGARIGVKHDF